MIYLATNRFKAFFVLKNCINKTYYTKEWCNGIFIIQLILS